MSSDYTYINNVLDSVRDIKTITIIASCTSIRGNGPGDYAFLNAKDTLEECFFVQGSQLQTIQQYSFYRCKKLKAINLSFCTDLTTIDSFAFNSCDSLTSVVLPEGISSIGSSCFAFRENFNIFMFQTVLLL